MIERRIRVLAALPLLAALMLTAGCGDDSSSGVDGDGGQAGQDAQVEIGFDMTLDAGQTDSSGDVGSDAATDTIADVGTDVSADSRSDSAGDADDDQGVDTTTVGEDTSVDLEGCEGASWGPTGICQGPDDGGLPDECCGEFSCSLIQVESICDGRAGCFWELCGPDADCDVEAWCADVPPGCDDLNDEQCSGRSDCIIEFSEICDCGCDGERGCDTCALECFPFDSCQPLICSQYDNYAGTAECDVAGCDWWECDGEGCESPQWCAEDGTVGALPYSLPFLQSSCGPADGSAFILTLTQSGELTCDDSVDLSDAIQFSIWGWDEAPSRIEVSGDGLNVGIAARCVDSVCERAARGWLWLDSGTYATGYGGRYTLWFDDGTTVKAHFDYTDMCERDFICG